MDSTPLQRLDDAIHTFLEECGDLAGGVFVTGWTVAVSTARLQSDNDDILPMITGQHYAFGPQTSVVQVAGLAKFLEVVAEKAMRNSLAFGEDD